MNNEWQLFSRPLPISARTKNSVDEIHSPWQSHLLTTARGLTLVLTLTQPSVCVQTVASKRMGGKDSGNGLPRTGRKGEKGRNESVGVKEEMVDKTRILIHAKHERRTRQKRRSKLRKRWKDERSEMWWRCGSRRRELSGVSESELVMRCP